MTKPAAQDPKDETPKRSNAQQKPTLGRIVHFTLDDPTNPNGYVLCPALVIGTNPENENACALLVFLPLGHANGFLMQRQAVKLDDAGEPTKNTWRWPARA